MIVKKLNTLWARHCWNGTKLQYYVWPYTAKLTYHYKLISHRTELDYLLLQGLQEWVSFEPLTGSDKHRPEEEKRNRNRGCGFEV